MRVSGPTPSRRSPWCDGDLGEMLNRVWWLSGNWEWNEVAADLFFCSVFYFILFYFNRRDGMTKSTLLAC